MEHKAVWKYEVPVRDEVALQMPQGAKLLHFGLQQEQQCLWALVSPCAPRRVRRFRLAGTGHPIAEAGEYVGTVLRVKDRIVFHLFDLGEVSD